MAENIKRSFRSISMPEANDTNAPDTKSPITIVKMVEENLLCDENLDQVSPGKCESSQATTKTPPPAKPNKRKTAHKTLEDDRLEAPQIIKIEDDEDEDVDIISYENKLSRGRFSLSQLKRKYADDENSSDEGVVADVLHVPVANLFEYGAEPDDIYLTDPFRYIKWKEGIGRLRNGSVHFKINEYGVYEVMSNEEYYHCKRNRGDRALEMSIGLRESRKMRPANDSIYVCKTCGETGVAEEFVEPRFCSWQCYDTNAEIIKLRAQDEGKEEHDEDIEMRTPSTTSESEDEDILDESWIKETDAPLSLFKDAIPKGKKIFRLA